MLDRYDQFRRGYEFHFAEILRNGVHINLESTEIEKAMKDVDEALTSLQSAIKDAKEKIVS